MGVGGSHKALLRSQSWQAQQTICDAGIRIKVHPAWMLSPKFFSRSFPLFYFCLPSMSHERKKEEISNSLSGEVSHINHIFFLKYSRLSTTDSLKVDSYFNYSFTPPYICVCFKVKMGWMKKLYPKLRDLGYEKERRGTSH